MIWPLHRRGGRRRRPLERAGLERFDDQEDVNAIAARTRANPFVLAVALGAGPTIITAKLTGFPVSTTHGLTGAIIGSGVAAAGAEVNGQPLVAGFLLPLILSPILAVMLAPALFMALRFVRLRSGVAKEWCVCIC